MSAKPKERLATLAPRHLRLVPSALILLGLAGCGGPAPTADGRYAIDGHVTSGGAPLEQGSILFHPQSAGGREAGATIRAGHYRLAPEEGLTPGRYAVEILTGGTDTPKPGFVIDEVTGAEVPTGPIKNSRANPLATAAKAAPPRKLHALEVTANGPKTFNFDISE